MSENIICQHGALRRQCELCEKDARIAELEAECNHLSQMNKDNVARFRLRCRELEAELQKQQAISAIHKRARERYAPCPDHNGKDAGGCLMCRNEQLEAELSRIPCELEERFYCLAEGHKHTNSWDEALCSATFQLDTARVENARLREALNNLIQSIEETFDTRRGELKHLRRLNFARAALQQEQGDDL